MEHHRKLVYSNRMPIRWGDEDAMGHVNNTVYFRYMEQTRIEWLESFRLGTAWTQTEGPVIVNASCTFLIPLTYPGDVECRMFVGAPGRSSVPTHYELRLAGDDRLFAEGAAKLVWINLSSGKSIPLPEAMRASCL
ncbi:MAG: acyl-CoA thioesterase [Rhodocyclaceae bacterium]|nr:MAG: acyl-CoA thioesterase [Rhodocyclaceae bacterium]